MRAEAPSPSVPGGGASRAGRRARGRPREGVVVALRRPGCRVEAQCSGNERASLPPERFPGKGSVCRIEGQPRRIRDGMNEGAAQLGVEADGLPS